MKRFGLLACALTLLCISANAVPAKPGQFTIALGDGTTLQVRQLGDEFHHSLATADGLTIAQGADGYYYYQSQGTLTTQRAHDLASRSAAEKAFLSQNEGKFAFSSVPAPSQRARARRVQGLRRATQVPNNGSPRVPIILVQYKDKKMSNTKTQFEAHYKTNAKSVLQYFTDQSNGLYTPQFDIYGIYTLNSNRSTYGANDTNGYDKGVAKMVGEAIEKAGNNIDWSQYDNNGDGEADVCIVVYAGVGEAQSSVTNAIWPCQWSLSDAASYGDGSGAVTRNGTTINKFAVFNEISGSSDYGSTLDGIGTFCHEFSHCLGLPDFYETTYSHGYYGMGNWSLMDAACYNGGSVDGDTPIGYSAYEKNFMGWIDLITPVENTQYTLPVFNSKTLANDQAIKITALNENEYWILENRKKQGWDYYIPDEGVLITHFTYVASRWDANTVNDEAIQLATIIPADNSLSDNNENKDLFGETNHAFTTTSSPAMKANMKANGTLASSTGGAGTVNKPVTEITLNSDGTASLWYMKGSTPTLTAPVLADATDVTTSAFTASWTHTATVSCTYTLNVTQGTTTVLNQTGITAKNYTVTGLEAGKTYTFKVKAVPVNATQAAESDWSNTKTVTLPSVPAFTSPADGSTVSFGSIEAGATTTQTVTVRGTNLTGNVTLALSGANAAMFSLSQTSITASTAMQGKTVTITYAPTAAGSHTAQLVISGGGVSQPATVQLTAMATEAVVPTITSPTAGSTVAFGSIEAGATTTQTVTVRGTNLLAPVTLALSGDNASMFSLSQSSITASTAMQGKTVTITYAPTAAGCHTAQLVISGGGVSQPVSVQLTATATEAVVTEPSTIASPELTLSYCDLGKLIEMPLTLTMPEGGNFTNIQFLLTFPEGLKPMADDEGYYGYVGDGVAKRNRVPVVSFNDNFDDETRWPNYTVLGVNASKVKTTTNPCHVYTMNVTPTENFTGGERDMMIYVKYTTFENTVATIGTLTDYVPLTRVKFLAGYDVNNDGFVDAADANAVINLILETTTQWADRADVNHDGRVSVTDLNKVIDSVLRQ